MCITNCTNENFIVETRRALSLRCTSGFTGVIGGWFVECLVLIIFGNDKFTFYFFH